LHIGVAARQVERIQAAPAAMRIVLSISAAELIAARRANIPVRFSEAREGTPLPRRFTIKEIESPRFEGDFWIEPEPDHTPSIDEQAYCDALKRITEILAQDEKHDSESEKNAARSAVIIANRKARKEAVTRLREGAEEFIEGREQPVHFSDSALAVRGIYTNDLYHIKDSLFRVEVEENETLGVELHINVAYRRQNTASSEQSDLFDAMSRAKTVISIVYSSVLDRANRRDNSLFKAFRRSRAAERQRAERLRDQYMHKLAGVGVKGLHGPHTELANRELEALRREFVAQEAGRIKNEYVVKLLIVSGIISTVLLGLYAAIQTERITPLFWAQHKAFLVAAAGSAIGAWLSFSIRRVDLSFDDLITLDSDWLDPILRILFIIGLTMTLCLLFWTGATNIAIGSLETAQFSGSTAFLIGVFSGIAERGLATAISGRAASFVGSVGSGGSS
jgi:hypothetical protein